jgi:hypothetical protein
MKPKYWAIIILATAAVCAGVFYYLNQPAPDLGPVVVHYQGKSLSYATTTTPSMAASSTIQSQADTSRWKTYASQQYGFSFKYPADWGNPIEGKGEISFLPSNPNADIPDNKLDINILTNNQETIDKLVSDENLQQGISVGEIKTTTLDGVGSLSFLEHREGGFANYGLFTLHGNYAYKIYYGNWFWGESAPETVIQTQIVLSTFKFIAPVTPPTAQTDTSGWKTYTNSQYGFSFRYPNNWNKYEQNCSFVQGCVPVSLGDNQQVQIIGVGILDNIDPDNFSSISNFEIWHNKNFASNGLISSNFSQVNQLKFIQTKEADGINSEGDYVYLSSNNIVIVIFSDNNNTESENILNSILSTFKFTK